MRGAVSSNPKLSVALWNVLMERGQAQFEQNLNLGDISVPGQGSDSRATQQHERCEGRTLQSHTNPAPSQPRMSLGEPTKA